MSDKCGRIVVSENANEYFKIHNITANGWTEYAYRTFNLKDGDHVFYEGNSIGYIKK